MLLFLKKSSLLLCCLYLLFYPSAVLSKALYINNLEWPPFFFSEHSKSKLGLGKEIINICLKKTIYQPKYKTLPVKRTHLYMQTGDIDISVYSFKSERNAYVYYGKEPLFSSSYALASKKENNIVINKLDDLNNYVIGHLSGLTHTPEILKIIETKKQMREISTGFSVDAMFSQLLASPQRFEVMPNSRETILWYAKQLGITNKITVHDLFIAEKNYYITISKFSNNVVDPMLLLKQLDNCILDLKANGHYKIIAQQYGL